MLRPELRSDDEVDIYVPEHETFIHFFGAGDESLSQEDFDNGCVDSIYYDLWRSVDGYINDRECSDDGGLICLTEYVSSKASILDWVPRVLEFIFTDSSNLRWMVVDRLGVARGTTLKIRFACENQLLDDFTFGGTTVCDDTVDLRNEIDKVYVREHRLDDMLDKLTDSLHRQNTKVLRPGVRIGTYVTCEHCVHCVQLEGRPNWMSCRRGHFGPTVICDSSLSFFCADGIPRKETADNVTDQM